VPDRENYTDKMLMGNEKKTGYKNIRLRLNHEYYNKIDITK
jgi:hypothetical protein